MSIDALSWAFNLELPSSGTKLTLLALANYANEDGEAYPSQKAMAKKTCLCERAIRTHLVALENLGIITRQSRKRANGSYTSDLFKLKIGAKITSGNNCQRQNLPAAENDKDQRQILPNPAADSAYPDPSLTTTVTKEEPSSVAIAPAQKESGKNNPSADTELQAACKATWKSYATAYFNRYGTDPIRNARVNVAIKEFCRRIPHHEAPHVAAFYLSHNDRYYVQSTHSADVMKKNAEGLRTQWATGRTMTSTRANQLDSTATNASAAQEAIAMLRRRNGNASV